MFFKSMVSGYHPETSGQTERLNQETGVRCLTSQDTSSWSKLLLQVEYTHNMWPSSLTGLSPFQCEFRYQHPLFPETEPEVNVSTAAAMVRRCHWMWSRARASLIKSSAAYKKVADRKRQPVPVYCAGQKVWLSTKDLPLRTTSHII